MIKNRCSVIEVILVFMLLAAIAPAYAQADRRTHHPITHLGVSPDNMLSLVGAAAEGIGGIDNLILVGGSEGEDFTVPSGKAFILTDIIISPQVFSPTGEYLVQVTSSPEFFTTAISIQSSAANPSSFQVNLTGGMVFTAGSKVQVFLVFGDNPVEINAFGYLVRVHPRHKGH